MAEESSEVKTNKYAYRISTIDQWRWWQTGSAELSAWAAIRFNSKGKEQNLSRDCRSNGRPMDIYISNTNETEILEGESK